MKKLNLFRRFYFVDGIITFHITNFTTLNAELSISKYQTILPCTLQSELLSSVWVTRASPRFFNSKIVNFGTAMIFQNFHLFVQWIAKNLAFFCSCCEAFTLYISRKKVCNLTVFQVSTVQHNSVQVSRTPKCLLCRLRLLWRTKSVSLNFAFNKKSKLLQNVSI